LPEENDGSTKPHLDVNGDRIVKESRKRIVLTVLVSLAIAACDKIVGPPVADSRPPATNDEKNNYGAGGFEARSSLKDFIFGNENDGNANGLPVNKYLWQASLSVLGASLPLASTDPFSGVIATDWGASANANTERVRVTATVQGTELTARGLSVSVFRETLSPSGAWIAAPVSPEPAAKLKDSILARAREIRIQDIDGTVL